MLPTLGNIFWLGIKELFSGMYPARCEVETYQVSQRRLQFVEDQYVAPWRSLIAFPLHRDRQELSIFENYSSRPADDCSPFLESRADRVLVDVLDGYRVGPIRYALTCDRIVLAVVVSRVAPPYAAPIRGSSFCTDLYAIALGFIGLRQFLWPRPKTKFRFGGVQFPSADKGVALRQRGSARSYGEQDERDTC